MQDALSSNTVHSVMALLFLLGMLPSVDEIGILPLYSLFSARPAKCSPPSQELTDHLKKAADITLPALTSSPDEAAMVEAALARAELPFVGSPAETLELTAHRAK